MIDTKEIKELTVPNFPDADIIDWVRQQPADSLTVDTPRNDKGQMCGIGLIAEFYGINWSDMPVAKETGRMFTFPVIHFIEKHGFNMPQYRNINGSFSMLTTENSQNGDGITCSFPNAFDYIAINGGKEAAKEFLISALEWMRERGQI